MAARRRARCTSDCPRPTSPGCPAGTGDASSRRTRPGGSPATSSRSCSGASPASGPRRRPPGAPDREAVLPEPPGGRVKNQLKTILLLGTLSALLVAFGASLGPGWMRGMTAVALAMNLLAYFFSDRLVLRMHRAREVPEGEAPRLHAIVAELAARAGIPKPR